MVTKVQDLNLQASLKRKKILKSLHPHACLTQP